MWNKEVAHGAFDYGLPTDLYRFCVEKWESVSCCLPFWVRCSISPPPFCGVCNSSQIGNVQHIIHIHIHKVGYVSHLFTIDQRLLWKSSQMYRDLVFKQLCSAPERKNSCPSVTCLKATFSVCDVKCHFLVVLPTLLQLTLSHRMICNSPREQVWTCCIQLYEYRSSRE